MRSPHEQALNVVLFVIGAFALSPSQAAAQFGGPRTGALRVGHIVSHVKMWHSISGRLLWETERESSSVFDLAFSPDGEVLASCDDRAVRLSDAKTGATTQVLWSSPHKEVAPPTRRGRLRGSSLD